MEEGVGESGARLGEGDAGSGKILELQDAAFVSQDTLESRGSGVDGSITPMLTPEKLTPEFVNSQDMVDEKGSLCRHEHQGSSGSSDVHHEQSPMETQESIECRSFMTEGDDYFAADSVSELSTSGKNYSETVDDGATSQKFEDKEINLGKEEPEDVVVLEIAERLSQLRSIGKTEESARKYILESDTEALEGNNPISELLGPKRLDFEVIDFDQFGAQPPDLPINGVSTKRHLHGGVHGGKEIKVVKKPESHVKAILSSFEHMEQEEVAAEMKGLHDNPLKKATPEKKHQVRKGTEDVHAAHVIPRLCNCGKEGGRGHDVSDTHSLSGRTGNSKLRLPDSLKSKKPSDVVSGSPIRRSRSTVPDLKGSPVHEESRRRIEDHKRLEEYCSRVDLSTAQLEKHSRRQDEVGRKLERECGERLKSEAKLKMLCEMLPTVEKNVKSLCDQMLSMEAQLKEQVGLRNKLETALERERQGRMQLQDQVEKREDRVQHLAVKVEEQVDLRNELEGREQVEQETQERLQKLEDRVDSRDTLLEQDRQERMLQEDQINKLEESLERELRERMRFAAKLEEQVELGNKLEGSLERELQERMQFAAKLEEQVELGNKLEGSLERELQERMQFAAKLEEQVELRNKLEASLERELQERMQFAAKLEEQVELRSKLEESLEERMQFAAKLEEQVELRNKLEESLDRELQERMQSVEEQKQHLEQERQERLQLAAQLDFLQNRLEAKERDSHYEEQIRELASKLERERNERLTDLVALPQMKEKLVDLGTQVESLSSQLKEQTQLKKELQMKLDKGLLKMHEEMVHKISSSVKKELSLKDLQDQVLLLATQLQEQIHLRKELEERLERMPKVATTERRFSREEESVFTKMLDEQKERLANQVKEAEMLKSATEKRVGLLNDQVQNLEMLFKVVEAKENVHHLRERATRQQTMWTSFLALSVGVVLVSFIVYSSRSSQSFIHPT